MKYGIFITGTDTAVGKTHVTAALLTELRRRGISAAAFKPIACGQGGRHDAEIYAAIMNHEQPLDVINPIYLRHPLAPSVAAKLEHKRIDLRKIFTAYHHLKKNYDVVLVEGAGGPPRAHSRQLLRRRPREILKAPALDRCPSWPRHHQSHLADRPPGQITRTKGKGTRP